MTEIKEKAAFSAPGKALLAGGYLVLFPDYSAYSVALSSRMHSVAEGAVKGLTIKSPQFVSTWTYDEDKIEGTHENPFLNAVVAVCNAYYGKPTNGVIEIFSDAGFHSQSSTTKNGRFNYHNVPITKVPKTGLGSSAALCTVAVAALMFLNGESPTNDLRKLHNLVQIAHCIAQKKVGSGFDVASAVYGSIIYSRFPSEVVPLEVEPAAIREAVDNRRAWNGTLKITPCALPSSIALVMGDVQDGSETPGMVRAMLQWRENNPEKCEEIWTQLNRANLRFMGHLQNETGTFEVLRQSIADIRTQLQLLTRESGVDIEPESQTRLIDTAIEIPGVINGVVPGAGGFDAVCLLVDATRVTEVVEALTAEIKNVTWTHLLPESKGLLDEDPAKY